MSDSAFGRTVSILQPLFLPWLGMFDMMSRSDIFIILDNVQFVRQSWQQRNRIKTAQGALWLTVPVKHRFGQRIMDVEIDYGGNWIEKHLKTISLNYRRAAYFNDFFCALETVYWKKPQRLVSLSADLLLLIRDRLKIHTEIVFSHDLPVENFGGKNYVIELSKFLNARTYLNGPLGRKLYDPEEFSRHGLNLVFHDYRHPVYPQLYGDFISHLSVIDLLFNCGPESRGIINSGYGES